MNGSRGNVRLLSIALYALMLVYAFSVTAIGPLLPDLVEEYGISFGQGGLFSFVQGIGGILGLIFGVLFSYRFRLDHMVKVLAGIYCMSLLAMGVASLFEISLLLFFFIGISTKLLDAVLNAYTSEIHKEDCAPHLSILHACFGIGALTAPMIIAVLMRRQVTARMALLSLGTVCIAVQIFYYMVQGRNGILENGKKTNAVGILKIVQDKNIAFLCLAVLCYTSFSCGCSLWLPSYMGMELGVVAGKTNFPIYTMWLGIIFGRLFCAKFINKFNKYIFVMVSNLVGGVVILIATFFNNANMYIAAYCITGFMVGGVVPLAVALANEHFPQYKSSISAIITLAGALGFMLFPAAAGILIEINFWYGILLLNSFPVLIAFFVFCARRYESYTKRGM